MLIRNAPTFYSTKQYNYFSTEVFFNSHLFENFWLTIRVIFKIIVIKIIEIIIFFGQYFKYLIKNLKNRKDMRIGIELNLVLFMAKNFFTNAIKVKKR